MRLRLALAAGALLTLAACGSNNGSGDDGVASLNGNDKQSNQAQASDNKSDEDKMRDFAKCMREHGIDMPEPGPDGRIEARAIGGPEDGGKMQKADEACRSLLPNGGKPKPLSPEELDKQRQIAKCMRDHGVDMPDPDPNEPGKITINGGPGPDSQAFKDAQSACQNLMPSPRGKTTTK